MSMSNVQIYIYKKIRHLLSGVIFRFLLDNKCLIFLYIYICISIYTQVRNRLFPSN